MQIDDETLMALADGELDSATAADLRARVDADPALQARLHRFRETRRRLSALRTPPQAGADPLAARIRAAAAPHPAHQAAPLRAEPLRRPTANLNRGPWRAAAASFLLVALGLGWWNWAGRPAAPALAPAELAALQALPSGQVSAFEGGEIAMIASYRLADGAFCREFETVSGQQARTVLACRAGGDWQARLAQTASTSGQDYRPASGAAGLEDQLSALGATEPMDAAAEARALAE